MPTDAPPTKTEKPICFVIAPIGKDASEIRVRSDRILKHLIKPVAAECGYETMRADHLSETGLITTQVINHIVNDAMVVADLTGNNPNVFYELAVRHATRKPYIQIVQKGDSIPFDVAGIRTIEFDLTDLDVVEGVKEEMRKQMKTHAGGTGVIESPISSAIDFDKLHRSDDPEKRQIADIIQGITDLKTMLEKLAVQNRQEAVLDSFVRNSWRRAGTHAQTADFDALVKRLGARSPNKITIGDIMKEIQETSEDPTKKDSQDSPLTEG